MNKRNYFVEIKLLESFTEQFLEHIPSQRKMVDEMMNEGIIISYSLALDRSNLWVVFEAKNEEEVIENLAKFPLIRYMRPEIHELAFHDNVHSGFPHLSLN